MTLTKAKTIEPTEEDVEVLRDLAVKRRQSVKDAKLQDQVKEKKRAEARRLAIARGELKA